MEAHRFSPTFHELQQEGYLFSSSLCLGLTALRRARVHETGSFYAAFFALSLGLERLLKTVLIIDHMLAHSLRPPDIGTLKNYGHHLVELYAKAGSIAESHNSRLLALESGNLTSEILEFLDEFAQRARYFNLDSLAGSARSPDPLAAWNTIAQRILAEDVSPAQRARITGTASGIGSAIEDAVSVIMSGLDRAPLNARTALALPDLHEIASRHAVYRIIQVLDPIKQLLSMLSGVARPLSSESMVPDMHEFLEWVWSDRAYVLRKKRWP